MDIIELHVTVCNVLFSGTSMLYGDGL